MTVPAACIVSQPSGVALNPLSQTPPDSKKSVKRKAAEALLQSRSESTSNYSEVADISVKRARLNNAARVNACTATHGSNAHQGNDWCDFDVCLPHLDWSRVALTPALETETRLLPHSATTPAYSLTDDITVFIIDRASQVPEALQQLKDSMDDCVVSIDLEWKPDYVRDTSKVALMQLSSSTCCLLIRLCKIGQQIPDALLKFFR